MVRGEIKRGQYRIAGEKVCEKLLRKTTPRETFDEVLIADSTTHLSLEQYQKQHHVGNNQLYHKESNPKRT